MIERIRRGEAGHDYPAWVNFGAAGRCVFDEVDIISGGIAGRVGPELPEFRLLTFTAIADLVSQLMKIFMGKGDGY